jgi:hypothetical protein
VKNLSAINRGIAWQSLWNRVENFKLKSSEFIKYVSALLEFEEEEQIVDIVSNYSNTVISEYCPIPFIPEFSHMLFEAVMRMLEKSPENKNLQRKIFTIAHTNEDICAAYNYSKTLARSEQWKGIMLYSTICSLEEVQEILEQELKYDRNDMSILLRNYCESAAYDNKPATWTKITTKTGLSTMQAEYLMRSFWRTKDLACLSEYYNKYFEVLPTIIDRFDREYAENFVRLMLPVTEDLDLLATSLSSIRLSVGWVNRILTDTIESLAKTKRHLSNFI